MCDIHIPVGPDWLSYLIEISRIFGSSWTDSTRSDHDREPTSTDSFLGPTDAVTGESIGYCQIQTDLTEELRNVSRSPVGSQFRPDWKPLLLTCLTIAKVIVVAYKTVFSRCQNVILYATARS